MLKEIASLNDGIINVYTYGSHVYGTAREDSDRDFILVVKDDCNIDESIVSAWKDKAVDLNIFKKSDFINMIKSHEITALECLFLPGHLSFEKENFSVFFELNKSVLRSSFSAKSSNSWVKAKKKFLVEKDYDPIIGKKSLWHSFRIMAFGIQIAQEGKISNFSVINHMYADIMKCNNWEEMESQYKQPYNKICSEFKAVAPKEINAAPLLKSKP